MATAVTRTTTLRLQIAVAVPPKVPIAALVPLQQIRPTAEMVLPFDHRMREFIL